MQSNQAANTSVSLSFFCVSLILHIRLSNSSYHHVSGILATCTLTMRLTLTSLIDSGKPVMLIFHCEFSSERAPKMAGLLRNRDRVDNFVDYPRLCFPEVFVLKGGYKAFFEAFPQVVHNPPPPPSSHTNCLVYLHFYSILISLHPYPQISIFNLSSLSAL